MKFLKSLNLEDCCSWLTSLAWRTSIAAIICLPVLLAFVSGISGRFLNCNLHFPRREIPHWFHHQRLGSSISFVVENDSVELTLWVDYIQEGKEVKWNGPAMEYIVCSEQPDKWHQMVSLGYATRAFRPEAKTWVNYGPQPYPLKTGDRIEVCFEARGNLKVEKCVIKAAERSSVVTTEIDEDVNALEISCNEDKVSKRWKPYSPLATSCTDLRMNQVLFCFKFSCRLAVTEIEFSGSVKSRLVSLAEAPFIPKNCLLKENGLAYVDMQENERVPSNHKSGKIRDSH
ncbi:hypothetical protein OSB04_017758 [Centaurea solstitialis]|uniref:Uncharacterized protein n=1 Tax=Centaurea solstitialis TaxID=347529 RepID=A0AA38TB22_9ASTR|nr:hypothetical protein OSB04_017758 [Centaurea solstitialis]